MGEAARDANVVNRALRLPGMAVPQYRYLGPPEWPLLHESRNQGWVGTRPQGADGPRMTCTVPGCSEPAKVLNRVWVPWVLRKDGSQANVSRVLLSCFACADHWPKVVG